MRHERKGSAVTAFITGELDHFSAQQVRRELDALIAQPGVKTLILDFGEMTFMDSSGIGVILGRYREMRSRGGSVCVRNMNAQVDKVFTLSGLRQVIQII